MVFLVKEDLLSVLGLGWVGRAKRGVYFDGWKWDVDWVGSGGADVICCPRVALYTCLWVLKWETTQWKDIGVHLSIQGLADKQFNETMEGVNGSGILWESTPDTPTDFISGSHVSSSGLDTS